MPSRNLKENVHWYSLFIHSFICIVNYLFFRTHPLSNQYIFQSYLNVLFHGGLYRDFYDYLYHHSLENVKKYSFQPITIDISSAFSTAELFCDRLKNQLKVETFVALSFSQTGRLAYKSTFLCKDFFD